MGGPKLAFSTSLTDASEEGIGALSILLIRDDVLGTTGLTDAPSEQAPV